MYFQKPPKPRFRDFFKQDLTRNLLILSDNATIQLFKHHIMTECIMYSCEMCLEFQRKSDGLLTKDWIEHIVSEVCAAMKSILPRDFFDEDVPIVTDKVTELMQNPSASLQREIDHYYNRI